MEWNNAYWSAVNGCSTTSGSRLVLDGRARNTDSRLGNPRFDYTGVFIHDNTGKTMNADAQVCSLTLTLYSPAKATWEALNGSDPNWSLPTPAGTTTYGGVTYYLYKTTYLQGACFRLGSYGKIGYNSWHTFFYGWRSTTCFSTRPGSYFRVLTTATVNNIALTKDSGWTTLA